MKSRAHFEHPNSGRITTIAPNPADGKSLADLGWWFVVRDMQGEEIAQRNPDEVRRETWRANGHVGY